jgi:hypothetical protein
VAISHAIFFYFLEFQEGLKVATVEYLVPAFPATNKLELTRPMHVIAALTALTIGIGGFQYIFSALG